VTRTTGNDFTLTDAAAMVAKLLPGWSPETTCWIVHPTVHAKLFALAANAGPAVTLTLFGKTPKLVLLGIPVETTDVLPDLGTPRDVVLADLAYYAIGTRQDFALAYSGEPFFTSNQGVWRLTSRVDGAPFVSGPITLADGSQVGPFAYLPAEQVSTPLTRLKIRAAVALRKIGFDPIFLRPILSPARTRFCSVAEISPICGTATGRPLSACSGRA
jgi:hypothetical protein